MVGVFKPKHQQALEITEHAQLVLDGAGLVPRAFPPPDLSVPDQPAHGRALPGYACRNARPQNAETHQGEAPTQLGRTLKMPKQNRNKAQKP